MRIWAVEIRDMPGPWKIHEIFFTKDEALEELAYQKDLGIFFTRKFRLRKYIPQEGEKE